MADPYPAGEVRCANLGRDNQPAGIFPDKKALQSLKASGASPVESLKLIDMIRQDGKKRLFSEIY